LAGSAIRLGSFSAFIALSRISKIVGYYNDPLLDVNKYLSYISVTRPQGRVGRIASASHPACPVAAFSMGISAPSQAAFLPHPQAQLVMYSGRYRLKR
jgi:hypothetical protein